MPERFTLDNHPKRVEDPNADDVRVSELIDWVITDNEPKPGYQEAATYAHFNQSFEQARNATDQLNKYPEQRHKWYWIPEHTIGY